MLDYHQTGGTGVKCAMPSQSKNMKNEVGEIKMTNNDQVETHHVLTLRQIAGWQLTGIDNSSSKICAGVPSLQRGLVWEPQQIEMLWDSLMRGFPVGAIVLSRKIQEQKSKASEISRETVAEPTHHILDGQQRSYAITLGFNDPWNNAIKDQAVLWLDIEPEKRLNNSVRKYLFRVTTKAHPWGFNHGDQSDRLSVAQIRDFMDKGHYPDRPLPEQSTPFDAGLPVPMFLLFKHLKDGKLNWDAIARNLDLANLIDDFSNKIKEAAANPKCVEKVETGLRLAEKAQIVALQVPEGAMDIENIEQIFQRLNRQGTPLDAEELVYSMIKAYWPEVEDALKGLPHHTTETRLIGMAVRVALTDKDGNVKMPAELDVTTIRNIFRPDQTDDKEKARRAKIKGYFETGELKKALEWIDDHLLYDGNTRAYGLPAYLRSSLAWNSRDVFAWLMALARQEDYKPLNNDRLTKRIVGLALAIHWFGMDKGKAVEHLLGKNIRSADVSLSGMKDEQVSFVLPLLDDKELKAALPLDQNSREDYLKAWNSFWKGVVVIDEQGNERKEPDATIRKEKYFHFVDRLQRNRELLIYVQRAYFHSKFKDFDPSNRLMWKGHNRPWDYDHILPSNELNATGRGNDAGEFHEVCKVWQQSIGNLVAVDLTFNRSAQDTVCASGKYKTASGLNGMFGNIGAYDLKLGDTKDFGKSKGFVVAAKDRLIDLYKEWYDTLHAADYK